MVAWSIYTIVEILYFILVFINKKYKHFKWDLLGKNIFGPNKNLLICTLHWSSSIRLLGAGIFGNGFGSLRDGMFGQFTRKKEPDGSLDLPGGDGGPLVVVGQFGSLGSDTFKEIIDKGVHDAHGFGGDTGVGVDLFQHLKDKKGLFTNT